MSFDDAARTFQLAMDRKIDDPVARVNWFGVAFMLGNTSEMDKQMNWSTGKPEGEDNFLAAKSDAEAYVGRDRSAREFSEKGELASRNTWSGLGGPMSPIIRAAIELNHNDPQRAILLLQLAAPFVSRLSAR